MKQIVILLALANLAIHGAVAQTDAEVESRAESLELAGAFSNDGFKIRDGHWSGTLEAGKSIVIAINLYAGNDYWFCTAGSGEGGLKVEVFDETGAAVGGDRFADTKAVEEGPVVQRSALGVEILKSGQYFLRMSNGSATDSVACSLAYLYK